MVIRAICTILANEHYDPMVNQGGPDLRHLGERNLSLEPHEFLNKLNLFGAANDIQKVRLDIQATVRSHLRACNFVRLNDEAGAFLVAWLNSALGQQQVSNGGDFEPPMEMIRGDTSIVSEIEMMDAAETAWSSQHGQAKVFGAIPEKGIESAVQAFEQQQSLERAPSRQISSRQAHISKPNTADRPVIEKQLTKEKTADEKVADMEKRDKIRKAQERKRKPLPEIKEKPKVFDELSVADADTINALRYELMKMQRELLRRKVLDPRHYNALSLDESAKQLKMGNTSLNDMSSGIGIITSSDGKKGSVTEDHAGSLLVSREIVLFEKELEVGKSFFKIEMVYNVITERITFRVVQIHDALSVLSNPAYAVGERMLVHRMDFSRVLFQRVTGSAFDVFMNDGIHIRKAKIEQIIEQIEEFVNDQQGSSEPVEDIVVRADRELYRNHITVDGVGVDVEITRNFECTGLIVKCSPARGATVGQANGGVVSLEVFDKELLVLLINQRSLFTLSQIKWQSLQVVAEWLVTLVRVTRVFVKNSYLEEGSAPPTRPISAISFDTTVDEKEPQSKMKSEQKGVEQSIVPPSQIIEVDLEKKEDPHKLQTILDVNLDRNVHIERKAFLQWRSRHVPRINGLNCKLIATQESETLRIQVHIKVPHPKSMKGDELIDFSKFFEDEEFFDTTDNTVYPSAVHSMSFSLTGQELLVFGSAKVMEEHSVSMSAFPGKNHPAEFMFNIINRLNVKFHGDLSDPYNRSCSAMFAGSWELEYDRKLFRDIRTISGGVLMLTASAIGGEILFDAEPTDGSIYKEVGSKLMEEGEIQDLVFGEGWPLDTLEPAHRNNLAFRALEKLKIIEDKRTHRLELYNFPESKLMMVTIQAPVGKPEKLVGTVEINEFLTLTDLRVVLQHELDRERMPRSYQFNYKGSVCAFRQEGMRRAWDLLPKCTLVPRKGNELKKKDSEEGKEGTGSMITGSKSLETDVKRRVSNKLVPVPLMTLARLQEETGIMHLLHPRNDFFQVGDMLKIGNIKGRDYTVSFMDYKVLTICHRTK